MKKGQFIFLLILLCCFALFICLFVPEKHQMDEVMPAIVIEKNTEQVDVTWFAIEGRLSRKRISRKPVSYSGKYQIDALPYTQEIQHFQGEFDFSYDKEFDCYSAVCGYKDDSGELRFANMYSDKGLSCIVYFDETYIVIAPAETLAEGRAICNKLGVGFMFE